MPVIPWHGTFQQRKDLIIGTKKKVNRATRVKHSCGVNIEGIGRKLVGRKLVARRKKAYITLDDKWKGILSSYQQNKSNCHFQPL